ncbi:hypothetical protein RJT34_02730 [Clitoria ternatea]|uniref:Uncharacterized protein n=1 Tax=Clitoria ternatea TaxID=43366 RepID=A0AAN9Q436_CLITE
MKILNGAIENAGPNGNGFGHAVGEAFSSVSGINDDAASFETSKVKEVEVEARGGEGAVVGVAVGGFEVTVFGTDLLPCLKALCANTLREGQCHHRGQCRAPH